MFASSASRFVQQHATSIYKGYRIAVLGIGALSLLMQFAYAQDVVVVMGGRILGFIFTLAGVAAALGGAVVGLKMIVGSTVGSAYATANAIIALIGVFGGLALAIAGPTLGAQIVDMTSSLSREIVVPLATGGGSGGGAGGAATPAP
jgi:hypothetical protein